MSYKVKPERHPDYPGVYRPVTSDTWSYRIQRRTRKSVERKKVSAHGSGFATAKEAYEAKQAHDADVVREILLLDAEAEAEEENTLRMRDLELSTLPERIPEEGLLRAIGECASHANPEWWLEVGQEHRPNNNKARAICDTCRVKGVCRRFGDHLESERPLEGGWMTAAIIAGEGPYERANRRKAAAKAA